MPIVEMVLDEGFYQNKPCRMNLKVKMSPWCHRGTGQYEEAQAIMAEFRTKLMALMEEYHDAI